MRLKIGFGVLVLAFTLSCTKKTEEPAPVAAAATSEEELLRKGKLVYVSRCVVCHSSDTKKDGALGPAVFGSSKELLEARILRLEYPAGYRPKRDTKMMTAMPDLANDIDALTAYLNQD